MSYKSIRYSVLVFLFFTAVVLGGQSTKLKEEAEVYETMTEPEKIKTYGTEEEKVLFIVEELERCPHWEQFREDETEIRRGITRIYQDISIFNTDTIRKACEYFLSSKHDGCKCGYGYDKSEKLIPLFRLIFDVPEYVNKKSNGPSYFWRFHGEEEKINVLYPYKIIKGELILHGLGAGPRTGLPYEPMKEFDAFSEAFGRRKMEGVTH